MDVRIRQIRAFVAVVRLGSFTGAAREMHLSQPALTVQIRNFEETLGCRLLDRTSRGVELTRVGREMLPGLQKSLADLDGIVRDARELSGAKTGTVRIAALPSFAASLLPDLVRATLLAHSGLRFSVKDAVANDVNNLVRNEVVDIGVTGGTVATNEFDVVQRARDRLCLVYPEGHPIGKLRRVTVRDIIELPLVLTAQGTSVRAVVDSAFARIRRAPLLACEPTYMMTAVAMVRAGLGLTILPGSSREVSAEPGLRSRPIDDASFVRPIALIKKRGRTLSAASASFLAICAKALHAQR